jgi:excisionase family DNA binding protein
MATTEETRPEGSCADFGHSAAYGTRKSELLTVEQVAAILAVSRRTVHRLVARGELPGPIKIGAASRFPAEEVQAYVEALKAGRHRDSGGGGKWK